MTAETSHNVHSIQGEAMPNSDIPRFEGNEVTSTRAKVTSASNLDVGDQAFKMDQTVRMVVETRVDGVSHDVDKDGKLVRVHRMKVLDSIVIDWKLDLEALRDGLR